jgi:hypothetical protein
MAITTVTRRRALQALAGGTLLAGTHPLLAHAGDPAKELPATGANLGSLFADVERLARGRTFSHSFLGDRFRNLDDFKKTARDKVFDTLLYRPDKVAANPKLVERVDLGDHFREKLILSTTPHFQVPAYVLIPKKVKTPAPAIVDLHSHGGMFLFGKDAKRIGCVGISMGGYRAAYLAGLDERIAAACVVGFMSSVRPMMRAHIDTHSWVHFLPTLHQFLDLPDVVSMMAPKPLLVQQCSKDALFPLEGMREAVDKIGRVYAKAGVKDRFEGRFYDVPHQYTRTMQDEAFAWFDRRLKG